MGAVRRVQLVILCEDTQHETFCRRFLRAAGWSDRRIRVVKAPAGRGAAEQFVRRHFPDELRAHRSRPLDEALVVMIDGDTRGVHTRLNELGAACRDAGVAERTRHERVGVFVPTWNIETWLVYLDGHRVDEGRPDYPALARERDCQPHVQVLHQMCLAGNLREPAPSSLSLACDEYRTRLLVEER